MHRPTLLRLSHSLWCHTIQLKILESLKGNEWLQTSLQMLIVDVSAVFRWLFPHPDTKRSTSFLYSVSRPSLTHPTAAESSEYLYWASEVCREKRTGESPVACGATELLTTCSDIQPFSLKLYSVCQLVTNPGNCGGIHLCLLGFLS